MVVMRRRWHGQPRVVAAQCDHAVDRRRWRGPGAGRPTCSNQASGRAATTADGSSADATISAAGRRVAFTSAAANLSPGKPDDRRGVFVYDLRSHAGNSPAPRCPRPRWRAAGTGRRSTGVTGAFATGAEAGAGAVGESRASKRFTGALRWTWADARIVRSGLSQHQTRAGSLSGSQGGHRGNRAVSQRFSGRKAVVLPRRSNAIAVQREGRVSPDRVGPSRVFSAARGPPPAADPAFLVGDDAGVRTARSRRSTARSRQDRQEVVQTILCRSGGKVENGVTCSQRCQARLIVGSARPTSRRRRRARRRPSWSGAVCRSHGSGLIAPSTSRRCSTPPGCSTARCSPGRRAARSSPWSSCSAGCEIDEACALRWRAIDFHSDVIRVEQVGKTAGELPRGRPVPRAAPSPPRAPLPAALDAAQRLGVRHEHR